MKRKNLIEHILNNGCVFLREGAKHSVFFNALNKRSSTVPRHNEINNWLAEKICRDLGVKSPNKNK
ncbi:MAG: addiction module toxin, HicA family [Candidatus Staskawiczbacteria bacterium RIFCSPHIGHO2_02_FULL_34_9]|uniref:Addiction module toxin, HicA family n=1 Tax=Candidatus Staskawiczbacteria bacterium RIFCSPHIGHO2_02_FULL_34_9 TaxID=1802206 RepID=A0A1G2HXG3_9BACT|nr:MAG: addiction module toxin, HicA family [Candidatus Staskawiczbacteria bacterium RIFCSPHIGHO2_02_FULL_34_9]